VDFLKLGEKVDYGPVRSSINFVSDLEDIVAILLYL